MRNLVSIFFAPVPSSEFYDFSIEGQLPTMNLSALYPILPSMKPAHWQQRGA
jgi:hypothetical protein